MPTGDRGKKIQWVHFDRGGRLGASIFWSLLGLGVFLLFWLPTRVPVTEVYSESYNYGFSNRTSQMVLAVLLAAGFFAAKWLGLQLPQGRELAERDRGLTPRLLWISLAGTVVFGLFFCWFTRPSHGIWDATYFIDRVHLLELGKRPYQDFEFVYGSFTLYVLFYFQRLFHLSGIDAYNLLYMLETLAGIVLLWQALRQIELPAAGKRLVFSLYVLVSMLWIMAMALNYTLFRYSLAFFCVTWIGRLDRGDDMRSRMSTVLAAFLSLVVLLGVSPEEGLAYAAATAAFLPLRRIAVKRAFLVDTTLMVGLFAATYLYARHVGVFQTMRSFQAGAFNLPLYPGPLMLILLASLLLLGGYMATGRLSVRLESNVAHVAIFSLAMLAGAMGRCDSPHVLGYELALLCCAMLLARPWPVAWRVMTVSFALAFLILPVYHMVRYPSSVYGKLVLWHVYEDDGPHGFVGRNIDHALTVKAQKIGVERASAKMQALRKAAQAGVEMDPHVVFPDSTPIVFAPMNYRPNKIGTFQSASIDEGYYFGLANITSFATSDRKVEELQKHPERDLVVNDDGLKECGVFIAPSWSMERLLLVPWVPEPKHGAYIFTPVCRYIYANYHWLHQPSGETFDYGLMRHN